MVRLCRYIFLWGILLYVEGKTVKPVDITTKITDIYEDNDISEEKIRHLNNVEIEIDDVDWDSKYLDSVEVVVEEIQLDGHLHNDATYKVEERPKQTREIAMSRNLTRDYRVPHLSKEDLAHVYGTVFAGLLCMIIFVYIAKFCFDLVSKRRIEKELLKELHNSNKPPALDDVTKKIDLLSSNITMSAKLYEISTAKPLFVNFEFKASTVDAEITIVLMQWKKIRSSEYIPQKEYKVLELAQKTEDVIHEGEFVLETLEECYHEDMRKMTKVAIDIIAQLRRKCNELSVLRNDLFSCFQSSVVDECWPRLQKAMNYCRCFGLLDEIGGCNGSYPFAEGGSESLHATITRIKQKHELKEMLRIAIDSRDEQLLANSIAVAKSNELSHMEAAQEAEITLEAIIKEREISEQKSAEETRLVFVQMRRNTMRLSLTDQADDADDICSDQDIASLPTVKKIENLGVSREEAVKLVLSKMADRENIIMQIDSMIQLEERRAAELRKRDNEKREDRWERERRDREARALRHQQKAKEQLERDERKIKQQMELLEKKNAEKRRLLYENRIAKEKKKKQKKYEDDLKKRIKHDRKQENFITLCDFIIVAVVLCPFVWESFQGNPLLETSCQVPTAFWSPTSVTKFACQVVSAAKVLLIVFATMAYAFVCHHIGFPYFGIMSIGSVFLYAFRKSWEPILFRSPWVLVFLAFNKIVFHCLAHYDKRLHWHWIGMDMRYIFIYFVFPIISFAISVGVGLRIACSKPLECGAHLHTIVGYVVSQALKAMS